MRILIALAYCLAAWRWGEWRDWRKYYPTILFMILIDNIVDIITYQHSLWVFRPSFLLNTDTVSKLFLNFTVFPATVILFLSRFPSNSWGKQIGYILLWSSLYFTTEAFAFSRGLIAHENGWSLGWSAVHNVIMFTVLKVHHANPLLAWIIAAVFFAVVWVHFGFGVEYLKQ